MGCFTKREANEFNFVAWQSGNNVLVSDLTEDISFCSLTLAAPSGLTATRMTFADVDLEWTSNSDGVETGFRVQVSTDNVVWSTLLTTASGVVTASVSIPSAGSNYFYRVVALGLIPSSPSNVSSFSTEAAPVVLDSITAVTVNTIDLSWTDTEGFASTYALQRADTIGGTYSDVVVTTNTSFQDTGLTNSTENLYRVTNQR